MAGKRLPGPVLAPEEIAKARAEEAERYEEFAEKALRGMTEDYIRRGRRIQKLGPTGAELFEEACQLADRIATVCHEPSRPGVKPDIARGPRAAADIFQNIGEIYRARAQANTKGKRGGAHDSERDKALLEMFDANNPHSPLSMARRGELILYSGRLPRKYTMLQIAEAMRKHPYWGAKTAAQIVRRLKELRKKHRPK